MTDKDIGTKQADKDILRDRERHRDIASVS